VLAACREYGRYDLRVMVDLERPAGDVAERYLSVAIDVSQVVGGKWWDPRAEGVEWGSGTVRAPSFDFSRSQLDVLTQPLAPAYLRIGGSEADRVYYDMDGGDERAVLPAGYASVLTRRQWDALHGFAQRNGLEVVFALPAGL
jgi:heparanase 1